MAYVATCDAALGPRSKTALIIHLLAWLAVAAGCLARGLRGLLPEEQNGLHDMAWIAALVFLVWSGALSRGARAVREANWVSVWMPWAVLTEFMLLGVSLYAVGRQQYDISFSPWVYARPLISSGLPLWLMVCWVFVLWYGPVARWWAANYRGQWGKWGYALFGWASVSGAATLAVVLFNSNR